VAEARAATGAPNFHVEVLAETSETHSYVVTPEHREYMEDSSPAGGFSYPVGPTTRQITTGHPASVQLTNLGDTIIVQKVTLNGRPEWWWVTSWYVSDRQNGRCRFCSTTLCRYSKREPRNSEL
jgi:hypothetical protein